LHEEFIVRTVLEYFGCQLSGQFESTIRALEQERDRYKEECELLRSSRLQAASTTRLTTTKDKVFLLLIYEFTDMKLS